MVSPRVFQCKRLVFELAESYSPVVVVVVVVSVFAAFSLLAGARATIKT